MGDFDRAEMKCRSTVLHLSVVFRVRRISSTTDSLTERVESLVN